MGKKIYLSPSNQYGNLYAAGDTNEMAQCNRIANATVTALTRCGFDVKKAPQGQAMSASIQESNRWGSDLHICIHTNAGGGNGTVVFVYKKSDKNMKYAVPIYESVQSITPGSIEYGVREYPALAELNSTTAVAVYIEVDFHDNTEIAKWLIDNHETVAEAIAKGVCKAFDVDYVEPSEMEKKIYRVQVGAFSEKSNADNFLTQIKAAGFSNAFIVEVEK